jgi:hypothetical protein
LHITSTMTLLFLLIDSIVRAKPLLHFFLILMLLNTSVVRDLMSQPHFGLSVRVKPTLPKVQSWSPPGLPKLKAWSQGSNLLAFECSWCHWKGLEVQMSKWLKLWAKEGPGVKLIVWLPTIKSRESTSSRRLQKKCNMALESSQGELQLWFRPHSNRRSEPGDRSSQSPRSPTQENFGTPPWESSEKERFGCSLSGELQSILYGGRWWLPLSSGRGESSVSKCPWLVSTPKGVPECELTFLWLVLDANLSEIILVPLRNLIPRLLARPSTPF